MVVVMQFVTCVFLSVAIFKIKKIVNSVAGFEMQTNQLVLHLAAFWVYFASYFIYYCIYLKPRYKRSRKVFYSSILVTMIMESFSIAALTYIIWNIFRVSIGERFSASVDRLSSVKTFNEGSEN